MNDVTPPIEDDLASVISGLAAYIDSEVAPLRRLAGRLATLIEAAGSHPMDEAGLAGAVDPIKTSLTQAADLVGLGYSAAPGVLRGHDNYLLWYQKNDTGCHRLVLNLDPDDADFYDYHDTEWFSGARELGEPAIYGPYLDYAGADRLVYTFAVPVVASGRFVGVAGADLDVAVVERRFADAIAHLDLPAAAITRDRVVIADTRAPWMPGERIPLHQFGEGGWMTAGPIGDWTGWRLVVGPSPGRRPTR